MRRKFIGNDFSLNWKNLLKGFWLLIALSFVIGVIRAVIEPQLVYLDVDWKVEPSISTSTAPHDFGHTNYWSGTIEAPIEAPDPVANLFRAMNGPGAVLLPKIQQSIPIELAFSRFYMGNDLSTCFCSGEAAFKVHWADRAYLSPGMFLDLSQPLENLKILRPFDTLDRIYKGGFFQEGPAPRIAGYEQLASSNFRFAVGELTDPLSMLASLSYARNTDWLSFPSKFAPAPANVNSPWTIYEEEQIFPWLGTDLLENFSVDSLTACALTHAIDFEEFPRQWQEPLSSADYSWLEEETAWRICSQHVIETYTNYRAGLVIAAMRLSSGHSALVLFSAHDNRLLGIRTFPFAASTQPSRHFTRLQFSPNGWLFAAYDNLGELYFFHTKSLQQLRHYKQVDGRSSRMKTVRLAFNSRSDRFIAPLRDSGDLVEVDFINNRLLRIDAPFHVSAFAYATSYDSVDTLLTVSAESGRVIKYRLDRGTAVREENFLLAGLYPESFYLNFSEHGDYLLATATEASVGPSIPPLGKSLSDTRSQLLVWDMSQLDDLDPVPSSTGSWPLTSGRLIQGDFVKLDRRADGFHVLVSGSQGVIDIPAHYLTSKAIDRAILLSSIVRPPEHFSLLEQETH